MVANIDTEIKSGDDLLPQGAQPGTIATDLEQATGLERVEILGKMEGIDVFDMRPLDSSRTGKDKSRPDIRFAVFAHTYERCGRAEGIES